MGLTVRDLEHNQAKVSLSCSLTGETFLGDAIAPVHSAFRNKWPALGIVTLDNEIKGVFVHERTHRHSGNVIEVPIHTMMHITHVLSREAYQSYRVNHATVPDEDLCGLHLRKDKKNCHELCLRTNLEPFLNFLV